MTNKPLMHLRDAKHQASVLLILSLLSALGFSMITGCDDRFQFLEDVNTPPTVFIAKGLEVGQEVLLAGSVKTSLKHNNLPYLISVAATDKETSIKSLQFHFVTGTGVLKQGGQTLTNEIALTEGSALIEFEPADVGRVVIEFFVSDDFGIRASAKADLNVFLNLPPKAVLNWEFLGTHGPYEYRLDASLSADQDVEQGGEVRVYHFIINDTDEILTYQPIIPYNFPGPGPDQRSVRLEVIDSDGDKSEMVSAAIN